MRWILAAVAVVAAIGLWWARPDALLQEATGTVAQNLCSKTFVSGLNPDVAYAEHLRPEPGMGLIDWALRYDVDRQHKAVRATIGGLFARQSVYRDGRGCTLTYDGTPLPQLIQIATTPPPLLPEIAGPDVVTAEDRALRAAIDAAFAEPGDGPPRATKAVVVVHDGHVIGERYAPGYGIDTPLLSHSIAKSVVNAILGVVVRQGALDVSQPAPVAAWRGADDPRRSITVDNLLRMNAGFGFDEGGGPSRATHMWFNEPDMARFAQAAPLQDKPGTRWAYNSGNFVILSRIIGDKVGGGAQGLRDFAQRELFGPLGMRSATLEFDATGTMMGANATFATPRDWARFGLLYLNDGKIGDVRVLPEGWVAYSTRPTGDAGYGAGFWLNTTDAKIPVWGFAWGLPGAPRDAFMARGYLGQYIVVVPSEKLVVVRFGQSHGPGAEVESVGKLVADVIASLKER